MRSCCGRDRRVQRPVFFPGFCAFCPHFRPFTRPAEALASLGLGWAKGRIVGLEKMIC
ncbi:hypothetical protein MPLDJ20_120041 [Mesorhizobium plurifarium]|uniref:Uncharacterized protein n=1 Tax=Mesorhizobium plurifarium TaxID=69974 RepID=A0A090EAD3_MESPL|nr:hypothetical protein MPLDJ20_120041 [Mesorhizobium plurifarium]CDX49690.1 hypothetical protein MPL3365_100166 [Mesorhizobium plurifarium]